MDNKKTNEAELTEKELTDEELEQVSGGDFDKLKFKELFDAKDKD